MEVRRILEVNPRLRWRWERDRLLLNTLISFNETAGKILEFCSQEDSKEAVVERMKQTYSDVDPQIIQRDVEATFEKFLKWNVLVDPSVTQKPALPMTPNYMEHIARYFNSTLSAPLRVILELTFDCQAECVHCFTNSPRDIDDPVTFEEWKNLVDLLGKMKTFLISFSGGEPLLYPELDELVEQSAQTGMRTTLDTNGYLLTDQRLDELIDLGLQGVYVSLHAPSADVHDSISGMKGLFDRAVHAIKISVDRGLEVQASTILSQQNKDMIPELMHFHHDLGVNRVSLMNFIPLGRGAENAHLVLQPEDVLELLPQIFKTDQEIGDVVFFYPDTPYAYYDRTIGKEAFQLLKLRGRIGACVAGILAASVNPLGEVTGCDACQGGVLGNIKEQPFDEIWRDSKGFAHLRTITREKQIPCKNCEFNTTCLINCKGLPSQVGPEGNPMLSDGYSQRCYRYFHKEGSS